MNKMLLSGISLCEFCCRVLQNVHLVAKWLPTLEKKLEQYSSESNQDYRVYISAEPAASAEYHIIPQGILEAAIKITNEPPTGMFANLHKALDNFNQVMCIEHQSDLFLQADPYNFAKCVLYTDCNLIDM